MTGPVECPACGAKLKQGRLRCLRCGAVFEDPAEQASAPAGPSQRTVLIWASLVTLLVVFGWLAVRDPATLEPQNQEVAAAAIAESEPPTVPVTVSGGPPLVAPSFVESSLTPAVSVRGSELEVGRLREAVQRNPEDAEAVSDLALALEGSGHVVEAIQYHERVAARHPQVWAYRFNLGRAYSRHENWSGAEGQYAASLALVPDDAATLYNLGIALHRQGRDEEAVPYYEQAIDRAPGQAAFHLALGISLERLKRPREAVDAYRAYLGRASVDAPQVDDVRVQVEALEGVLAAAPTDRAPSDGTTETGGTVR